MNKGLSKNMCIFTLILCTVIMGGLSFAFYINGTYHDYMTEFIISCGVTLVLAVSVPIGAVKMKKD